MIFISLALLNRLLIPVKKRETNLNGGGEVMESQNVFVVISKYESNVRLICVCKEENYAKEIVEERLNNFPNDNCWYQETPFV